MTRKRRVSTWEYTLRCERCGHRWKAIGEKPPRACARCKATGWNRKARPYKPRQK